ncbi:MAG: hypothetical protein AAF529_21480 [Pseudomonadota bacterium]
MLRSVSHTLQLLTETLPSTGQNTAESITSLQQAGQIAQHLHQQIEQLDHSDPAELTAIRQRLAELTHAAEQVRSRASASLSQQTQRKQGIGSYQSVHAAASL